MRKLVMVVMFTGIVVLVLASNSSWSQVKIKNHLMSITSKRGLMKLMLTEMEKSAEMNT